MKIYTIILLSIFGFSILSAQERGITVEVPDAQYTPVESNVEVKAEPLNSSSTVGKALKIEGHGLLNGSEASGEGEGSFELFLPPGEFIGVKINHEDNSLEPVGGYEFSETVNNAVSRVPAWFRVKARHTFSMLDEETAEEYAALINEAQDPYVDEIAFAIVFSSKKYLESKYAYKEFFSLNAELIYTNDEHLPYVKVVDYGTSADDDYYSTVSYARRDSSGNKYDVEVPKEIYYWYIVHPKLSDETPGFVDPEIAETSRNANVTTPQGGSFWREWLFTYTEEKTDTPGVYYPILRDVMSECEVLYDGSDQDSVQAIRQLAAWVREVLDFTSKDERPHQPIRIYKLHIGRCGEHEDLTNAACRASLIPARGISAPSQDHVWNEFWDEGWHHAEPVSKNKGIRNKDMYGEYGWGRHFGTVYATRSDGVQTPVTGEYTPHTCEIEVTVLDSEDKPIDGAIVQMYARNEKYYPNILYDSYAVSDHEGKTHFTVGRDNRYYIRMISRFGSNPVEENKVTQIVDAAEEGMKYKVNIKAGYARPLQDRKIIENTVDSTKDHYALINYDVAHEVINWEVIRNDLGSEFAYYQTQPAPAELLYMTDTEYQRFKTWNEYESEVFEIEHTPKTVFNLPVDEDKYLVLKNPMDKNMLYLNGSISVADYITSVEKRILEAEYSVYPNPVSDIVNIRFNAGMAAKAQMTVYSSQGTPVYSGSINITPGAENMLSWNSTTQDGSEASSGLYVIEIRAGKEIIREKIILR